MPMDPEAELGRLRGRTDSYECDSAMAVEPSRRLHGNRNSVRPFIATYGVQVEVDRWPTNVRRAFVQSPTRPKLYL